MSEREIKVRRYVRMGSGKQATFACLIPDHYDESLQSINRLAAIARQDFAPLEVLDLDIKVRVYVDAPHRGQVGIHVWLPPGYEPPEQYIRIPELFSSFG